MKKLLATIITLINYIDMKSRQKIRNRQIILSDIYYCSVKMKPYVICNLSFFLLDGIKKLLRDSNAVIITSQG